VKEKHAQIARENIERAGVSDRVEILVGKGMDILPKLVEEVGKGQRERFGLVYIDADKVNNWNYLNLAVQMCKPGACIIVDNVVRKGLLVNEEYIKAGDPAVMGARELVEKVGKDERIEGVVMQTVAEKSYDGFLMAVVR